MWNFQRSIIKKEVEFQGVIKKKSCRISVGSGFWPLNFVKFPGMKLRFVCNFQGKNDKPKISRVFFKKVCPQSPLSGGFVE